MIEKIGFYFIGLFFTIIMLILLIYLLHRKKYKKPYSKLPNGKYTIIAMFSKEEKKEPLRLQVRYISYIGHNPNPKILFTVWDAEEELGSKKIKELNNLLKPGFKFKKRNRNIIPVISENEQKIAKTTI